MSGRAPRDEREAIGRLLQEHSPRLRAVVRSAGVPSGEIEDAVQEAIARALAHWDPPRGERQLAKWLAVIARNVAVDWRRRGARERRVDRDPALEVVRDDGAAPSGAMTEAEHDTGPLPGLADGALTILLLRYGEGLDGREIAARLGLTYEATKKRLQRARADALARLRGRER